MKYKVGDRVRIKKGPYPEYSHAYITPQMESLAGQVFTIAYESEYDDAFHLNNSAGNGLYWYIGWFEPEFIDHFPEELFTL